MAFEYTLDKVSKLGDFDETYGQRYWCESPVEDRPISFNSKEDIELTEESGAINISAEERVEKRTKKGTDYYQLKKVKVGVGGIPRELKQQAHPTESQLDRIERDIKNILRIVSVGDHNTEGNPEDIPFA